MNQKDEIMDYAHAVSLAKNGDEDGFKFLYEKTYREKYYIAIKYMKSKEAAQDVLQDAYIRAYSQIATLQDPSAFPGWFGQIVANTAKNALVKKNPILFSEMNNETEGDKNWEYQIEDDKTEYRPEEAYSQNETQELVHELIDSLSDEQRLCVLMFYIEGQSIKDIASAIECSENTVKSRLNYGRKNLKIKAESLQKKGYKLYSIAPLPILLYLMHAEQKMFVPVEETAAMTGIFQAIKTNMKNGKVINEAIKQTFIHTIAGKITVAVAGIVLASTVTTGAVMYHNNQTNSENMANTLAETRTEVVETTTVAVTDTATPQTQSAQTVPAQTQAPAPQPVAAPAHVHDWQPHYATRTVKNAYDEQIYGEVPVMEYHRFSDATNEDLDVQYQAFIAIGDNGQHYSFSSWVNGIKGYSGTWHGLDVQVGTKTAVVNTVHHDAVTEQYIDYYACKCGATK